jgi:hypothetical protein
MARTGILTGGSNNAQTTSEDLNGPQTDLVSDGVVGTLTNTSGVAPMTGGLALNAQGSPNTTTAVTAGVAYVTATPTSQGSQRLRVKIDAQNITHASNSTGGTRYDWVYVKVDAALAANPIADMSTTGTVFVSRSTSSSVDNGTPPSYGHHIATVTLANGFSSVTNGNIADTRAQAGATFVAVGAGVGSPQVATGVPVQIVSTNYSTAATGTTLIPYDDTIPQITEGTEFMTQAITPKSATNRLLIEVTMWGTSSVSNTIACALFQDATANALAATGQYILTATATGNVKLTHDMVAGTTSSTTFRVRGGSENAGTFTFNGAGGTRRYGGVTLSNIKITEYKA